MKQVERHAEEIANRRAQWVAMAHQGNFAVGGLFSQFQHEAHHSCLNFDHRLAARWPHTAAERVEVPPTRQAVQLTQAFPGPVSEVEFVELLRHPNLNLSFSRERRGGFLRPLQ